jgi:hypothetical protein
MFNEGSEPSEYCTSHPGPPLRSPEPGADPRRNIPRDTEREPEVHIH